uniref:Uncharacterized protein n=1 Tax=Chromera velia CCMP2878 TaxID=1169474 RepID=A0A0G4HV04_9ALVE|eukprot:Cvel_31984.t1-p1 / transcript=Cvel_31984.t1 / gene=Cvel_31984 / organism=Chromera_velia_CCMP2878 / gene_product=hypothetical protein / transcript_product=hypothetical protein / location=Cvel_scaffold4869:4148-5172(-) / protein_length=106 / sequence_SO=supercontig / SO=protein_coding / is_pseudo=false
MGRRKLNSCWRKLKEGVLTPERFEFVLHSRNKGIVHVLHLLDLGGVQDGVRVVVRYGVGRIGVVSGEQEQRLRFARGHREAVQTICQKYLVGGAEEEMGLSSLWTS